MKMKMKIPVKVFTEGHLVGHCCVFLRSFAGSAVAGTLLLAWRKLLGFVFVLSSRGRMKVVCVTGIVTFSVCDSFIRNEEWANSGITMVVSRKSGEDGPESSRVRKIF